MARGDGGKAIFEDDDERKVLLAAGLGRKTSVGVNNVLRDTPQKENP